jgi:hypothetical protein
VEGERNMIWKVFVGGYLKAVFESRTEAEKYARRWTNASVFQCQDDQWPIIVSHTNEKGILRNDR